VVLHLGLSWVDLLLLPAMLSSEVVAIEITILTRILEDCSEAAIMPTATIQEAAVCSDRELMALQEEAVFSLQDLLALLRPR